MDKLYKVVITGTFNAGKTTFVKTLSDISPVNTDKATSVPAEREVKSSTTTALDYGQVKISEGVSVHMFGTPGQPRFDFMRDILARGMDGFVFLVDANDRSRLDNAGQLLAIFKELDELPFIVVANKADLPGLSTAELRTQLGLSAKRLIVPCVATEQDSVRMVVDQLVALIEQA